MDARYVELEVLGEGGMGQVQRVRDDVLGRSVARKVMHPEIADRADGVDRFLREARCPSRRREADLRGTRGGHSALGAPAHHAEREAAR